MKSLRLALSMFTIFRVGSNHGVTPDRATCAAAMRWFPLVGVLLALVAEAASLAFWRPPFATTSAAEVTFVIGASPAQHGSPYLAAVAVVAIFAIFTRGLHLDGLADVADGLGSAKPADEALDIMKRSDIGPFGVVTVLFVLLVQVAALAWILRSGTVLMDTAVLIVSAVTARVAVLHACATTVPSARPAGLGAMVAGTASRRTLVLNDALLFVLIVVGGAGIADYSYHGVLALLTAAVAALLAGRFLVGRCIARLGGVTGDVFGAVLESAMTVALLAFTIVMEVHVG